MAALYPSYKKLMLDGGVSLLSDTIKLQLVDSTFQFNPAHVWLTDVPDVIRRGTPATLTGKTTNVPEAGVFDALDTSVPGVPAGGSIIAYVLFKDTGTPATSPLLAFIDGFYLEAQGGPVVIEHDNDPERIFRLPAV
jgi:hypothetical protein